MALGKWFTYIFTNLYITIITIITIITVTVIIVIIIIIYYFISTIIEYSNNKAK